ncbi:hypothetical protein TEA_006865 [Camellia sinensis var. sinensis]|uniref:NPR1/NIM1-like C-terminal domain-containing protein n=1 Tax=Camellia sinensis var. sinensis TaxID=542762 RepID=A0A4S4EMS4_CAMSN|nr:hypothetical protein TEA_006865 [Camellia sinensis var. sinensis]
MLRSEFCDVSMSSPTVADDLHMKLLYLENRVAFAKLFFPTEVKLAMDIAHAETSEFAGHLNETPLMQKKGLLSRMQTLSKAGKLFTILVVEFIFTVTLLNVCGCHGAVEMGRRYFPHCSEVFDKFMEDDLTDLFYLEKGTPEEQLIKRKRFVELKEDVQKAFNKDKAELHRSGLSSL